MKSKWSKILGQIQHAEPDSVETYVNDRMGIFLPKKPFRFDEIEHIHNGYEFVIPLRHSSPYKVENKVLPTKTGQIFPFNPKQSHIAVDENTDYNLIALFFEADFMKVLAGSIFDNIELEFANRSFEFDAKLKYLLQLFMDETRQKQKGYEFTTQSIALQIGIHLIRALENNCQKLPVAVPNYDKKHIKLAIDFINDNYRRNFTLNEIAQAAYLSPYHFSRIFKAEVGKSPFTYLTDLKIKKAKEFLLRDNKSITQICFECGFNDVSYFSRTFTGKVGVSPSIFRKYLQN